MATYNASKARGVAIELYEKSLTLYLNVLPIFETASAWVLNSVDPDLPQPFDLKVTLDAYAALKVERLQLTDWVTQFQAANPGDTLIYPPAPAGGLIIFDETIVFNENLIF